MGNLFGKKKKQRDNVSKQGGQTQQPPQPKKDRITEQDKAILDVKARMRKIKTYIDKLTINMDQQNTKVKDFLKAKQKQRALIALKHRKFLGKELDKASGAQSMLQQTISNIESAQMDIQLMEALKQGDKVISELQSKASLEDFEELYDRHQEQKGRMEMEQEMFGQAFNEGELEDELAALDEEIINQEIPSVPTNIIDGGRSKYQEKSEQEPAAQTRQLVHA